MKANRIPESKCPRCGYTLDAASDVYGEASPSIGDVTLCLACGEILVFDPLMKPIRPTIRQLIDLQHSPEWPKIDRVAKAIRARRRDVAGWPKGSR